MMMHTPGPWTVDPKTLAVYAPDRHGHAAAVLVADCDCSWLLANEIRANAALVAAAPDLLAALLEVVAEWDARHADEDHRSGYTLDTGGIAQARAAIARATGGQ